MLDSLSVQCTSVINYHPGLENSNAVFCEQIDSLPDSVESAAFVTASDLRECGE